MADEEEREEEETETPKEREKEKEKDELKATTVERDRKPERVQDRTVDCPECDLSVREDKLGSHRWKAHQVERRADAKARDEADDDDGLAPPKKHTTTKKKTKEPEPTGLFGAWKR